MNANRLVDKVIAFVAGEAGLNPCDISMQTDLRNDLGIDGDDAIALMSKFSQEFQVDVRKFEFKRHFSPEGFNPLIIFFPSWWRREFEPITIADLVRAAESGAWC